MNRDAHLPAFCPIPGSFLGLPGQGREGLGVPAGGKGTCSSATGIRAVPAAVGGDNPSAFISRGCL